MNHTGKLSDLPKFTCEETLIPVLLLQRSTPKLPARTRGVTAPFHSLPSTPDNALSPPAPSHHLGPKELGDKHQKATNQEAWQWIYGKGSPGWGKNKPPEFLRDLLGGAEAEPVAVLSGVPASEVPISNHPLSVCPPFKFQIPRRDSGLASPQSGGCYCQRVGDAQRTAGIIQTWPMGTCSDVHPRVCL